MLGARAWGRGEEHLNLYHTERFVGRNKTASLLPSERENAMWTWKRPNYLLVGAVVGLVALLGVGCGHSTGGPYERAVTLLNDYPLIDGYTCMYRMRVQLIV